MRTAASIVVLIILCFSAIRADTPAPKGEPEYYYTRVIYTGNGTPERGGPFPMRREPLRGFRCSDLERGEGGFGGGWITDYPASDCKFMWGVERLTNINAYREAPHPMPLMDPNIWNFPYLYIVEPGQMLLSRDEAARLREFLLRGGFLHIDDFWGLYQLEHVTEQIAKVFPDRKFERIPMTDKIFHAFYDIDTIMQIPNVSNGCYGGRTWESPTDTAPRILGIRDDTGRLMVVATYNSDLGDAWEHMDNGCYPYKYSGQAYRMGINFIIYSMSH
jgi:hypothetical protein